jgi:hypothetical protein
MNYKVEYRKGGARPWKIINKKSGRVVGCSLTEEIARLSLDARYGMKTRPSFIKRTFANVKRLALILGLLVLTSCSSGTYLTPYTPTTEPTVSAYQPSSATTTAVPVVTLIPTLPPLPPTPTPLPTPALTPTPTQIPVSTPTPTLTPTPTPPPPSAPPPTPTVILPSEQSITAYMYASITIGGFVNQIGYALSNESSQPITVIKVEFLDQSGNIKTSTSEETIQAAPHKGVLQSGMSFNWSKSFQTPYPKTEVEQWIVKWYCRNMNASPFIIIGHSASLP